ncbi:ribokinase [Cyphellophora europaea CBS 101466]|uniref:Ribokinase n=1 Tax=Cyphellophora europaea (strain CBS 101466) TaxID=1220924 RepID=W2RLU8_CYPE1|nr:ribokinase [Cyphellophora europaea CBS 101466]ETN36709.1 ribokinase [Cyphellophora europaea CBS 101466]
MSSKPVISVIGSLNVDFVTLTPRVPAAGETLTATSLAVHPGGKGANQAVSCGKASFATEANQDVTVEMVGCVGKGDPYYASLLKPTLEQSGVGTSAIEELEGSQTGTATILVEENGQNRILFVPGANFDGMRDSAKAIAASTQPTEPSVLVMQGEIPADATFKIIEHFGRSSTQVVLNPAPVYTDGVPASVLKHVDFLVVNETECMLLAQAIPDAKITVKDEEDMSSDELKSIAATFHQTIGVRNLLVTLGAKGVFYSTQAGQQDLVSGLKVPKVVDTTAAGDTFVGYFAAALARHIAKEGSADGFNIAAATLRANAAAALCVQRSGAMQSIPFGYEVK